MKKIFVLTGVLFFSLNFLNAQKISDVTPEQQKFYDKAMPVIKRDYKDIVINTAKQLRGKIINSDSLVNAMKAKSVLSNLQSSDIEALCFLVLMEASKDSREDLKSIMAETKEVNKEKQSMRNQKRNFTKSKNDSSKPNLSMQTKNLKNQNEKADQMNNDDESSLRLQMVMDRRSKILSALSNIMNKISKSQEQIISNLK